MQSKADMHVHSEYSNERLKDSTNRIKELLGVCKQLGITSLAITDHDILTGHIQFLQETEEYNKKNPDWQIKPILGNECYVVDDERAAEKYAAHYPGRVYGHLILLAKNTNGYKQIRELSKVAWTNSFKIGNKYTASPVNFSDIKRIMVSNDVICSTACLGSLFAKYVTRILEGQFEKDIKKVKEYHGKVVQYLKDYKEIFGDDFYIELQPNKPGTEQWNYNKLAIGFAEKYNISYVITTDAHYLRPEDRFRHEIFLKSDKEDAGREVKGFYDFTYLMSAEEIHDLMDENIGKERVNTALENTLKVADKIETFSMKMPTQMPVIDLKENIKFSGLIEKYCGENWSKYPAIKHFYYGNNIYNKNVMDLIEKGLKDKIVSNPKKRRKFKRYITEVEVNLDVLWDFEKQGSNFSQYFLVTKKIIDLIWEAGSFVGVARGSSPAFLINYLMGIVDVDAIEANFPYWRFLAKGRKDVPDVDIDSNPLYKQRILRNLYNFFGTNNVLPISTTGTEGSKSIVLSTFRAYNIDSDIAQRVSDIIPVDRGKNWPLSDCIFGNPEADRESIPLMEKYYKQYKEPLDVAISLEGLINKRSSHASGILIYPEDYLNYNSMMKAPGGLEVSSYTMEDSQYCGGIKEDLLYTEFESKLQLCVELMQKDGIVKGNNAKELYQFITPSNLDLEDEGIWKNIFHSGNVKDVFQMEGATGIDICQKVKPNNIMELAAANSLMRLKSDISVEFIASQEGFEVKEVTEFMKALFENEQLSDKFLRYKNDPQEFIDDTVKFGLTEEWAIKIYEVLQDTYGVLTTQEDLMRVCMEFFNFNIIEAHNARKGVA